MNAIFSVGPRPGADPSTYTTDQYGIDRVKRAQIAHEGLCIVYAGHDSFYGKGKDYKSRPILNPTWAQILRAATAAIKCTGDYHHVFLEGVFPEAKIITKDGREATVLRLSMGS